MRATRYRLKFFTGATLVASTYGGGKYGDGTYGMQASDALTTAHHRLVPLPGGALTSPSWAYRQNDTQPDWEAQIIADDGVVDFNGLSVARLILSSLVDAEPTYRVPLTVVTQPNGDHLLRHVWATGELSTAGQFRAGVQLTYNTGRRLSVPADDRHLFVITPDGSTPSTTTAEWDAARWDASDWS